jgi:hypothetical protein
VEDASASIPLAYDFEDANGGADTNVLITSAKDDQPSDVKYTFLTDVRELDKEKNQCIRQKTGAQNIVKEIKQYQEKWLQHVQSMDTNRLPKQALKYKPKGRRNIGRPGKRWRDQLHLEDEGTG